MIATGILLAGMLVAHVLMSRSYKAALLRDEARFIDHWSTVFRGKTDLESMRTFLRSDEGHKIFFRELPSGEWIAVAIEYACADGAGFDASVFWDSKGRLGVNKTHHFCGLEGLYGELNQIKASDLAGFYRQLASLYSVEFPVDGSGRAGPRKVGP